MEDEPWESANLSKPCLRSSAVEMLRIVVGMLLGTLAYETFMGRSMKEALKEHFFLVTKKSY